MLRLFTCLAPAMYYIYTEPKLSTPQFDLLFNRGFSSRPQRTLLDYTPRVCVSQNPKTSPRTTFRALPTRFTIVHLDTSNLWS